MARLGVEGPPAGVQLEGILRFDNFWFTWSAYRPGTLFIEE